MYPPFLLLISRDVTAEQLLGARGSDRVVLAPTPGVRPARTRVATVLRLVADRLAPVQTNPAR
jgi:hypothetical protein